MPDVSQPIATYLVRKWYVDYLHREPDSAQVQLWWVNEILTKGLDAAFAEFQTSPEGASDLARSALALANEANEKPA